jgi:hypothetical protein
MMNRNKLEKTILFLPLLLSIFIVDFVSAQVNTEIALSEFPGTIQRIYMYRDTVRNVDGRFPGFSPMFLIYPDKPCTKEQALNLIKQLGLNKYIRELTAMVCVINPIGNKYDEIKDFEAYKTLLNKLRVFSNLKLIGIGNGATFINHTIAFHAGAVAGIVSINGKPSSNTLVGPPVPSFISGINRKKVATMYIKQNSAVLCSKDSDGVCYQNRKEPLLKVYIDNEKDESLNNMFDHAWNEILSQNYRFNNYMHTWYTGCSFEQYGNYELEPYIMLDKLHVKRYTVEKDLLGTGKLLWYEYLPEKTIHAEEGTIPLLLLLHGNTNDPRTQAETSGFVELCAKKNFMIAELEWQGNNHYVPMGLDGIEQVVYYLLKKYPQLDASRIYAEGLSAGSLTATALGIKKSYLFAAVGGHSGGIFPNRNLFGYSNISLMNDAKQKRGKVEMPYFSVSGTDDEVVPYPKPNNWKETSFYVAWRTYQTMNGMPVVDNLDFTKDSCFGIGVKDRKTILTNKDISIEMGTLYKGTIPMIQLVAVDHYGHWNFKPDAELMWAYFTLFSRDVESKELKYSPQ